MQFNPTGTLEIHSSQDWTDDLAKAAVYGIHDSRTYEMLFIGETENLLEAMWGLKNDPSHCIWQPHLAAGPVEFELIPDAKERRLRKRELALSIPTVCKQI